MVPAVLVRKSTKEIIKHDLYPREDMQPVEGMDPDYEWLIQYIPYAEPDYDPRIYLMVTNLPDLAFLDSFSGHPQYPGLKGYTITYSPEKRPKAEIIVSIENTEKEMNNLVYSESSHKDDTVLMTSAIYKATTGATLTEQEQSYVNKLLAINLKISKNLANKNLLVGQVNSNQEPNIDLGWEKL